jgi:hypothetical protein
VLATESLEPRALLAVTAELIGGDLVIAYNDSGDVLADISSDGTKYTVSGTGLVAKQFKIADVTVITVADKASKSGQTFQVLSGNSLAAPLQVNANVETASLLGGINASLPGDVLIGSATISLANDISTATTNGNISLTGAVTLEANVALNAGSGAISFNGTVDGAQTLGLTAGTGNVTFTGVVGNTTPLGAITINSAKDVTANGIRAASLTQVAGSGTTTLNGGAFTSAPAVTEAVRTTAAAGVSLTGTSLAVNAAINAANGGTVTFDESNTITIAAAGAISADGAVSMKAVNGITTAGDVTTTNDDVTFQSATTLSGPVAVNTGAGAGNITFSSTVDGAQTLGLTAGTGNVTFEKAVGDVTPLAGISLISAGSTTADSSIKLVKTADSGQDGLTVAAGVNNVKMIASGSSITGFAGNGITFLGGSTNSQLAGFTVSENSANGMNFAAGSYAGTTIAGNTIRDNGNKTTGVGNGILVQGSKLMIGWDANPASNTALNVIEKNALNGIEVRGVGATQNSILSNSIYLNGIDGTGAMRSTIVNGATVAVGKGIALTEQGNAGQVSPIIHDVVWDAKDNLVRVQVEVPAAGSYFVQVFGNIDADEQEIFPVDVNGFEGRTFVGPARAGSTAVAGSKPSIAGAGVITGNTLATLEIPTGQLAAGNWLTATAILLDGTSPTNTSEFSAGAQVLAAPVLAVGGDGPSTAWTTEYAFTAASGSATTIQITTNGAGQILTNAQLRGLSQLKKGTVVVVTPTGGAANEVKTVKSASLRRSVLTITLNQAINATSGTFVIGGTSLPAAQLLNTSLAGSQAEANAVLSLTETHVRAALIGAGVTATQADAFVTRFQGGLRVASGDFNGDGHADLVTVAGGLPAAMAATYGDAPLVLSIHNANPATLGTWADASVNLLNVAGFISAGYVDGFLVTVGNVWEETSGSDSVVQEVIVASSTKIAVIEVQSTRGGKPEIKTDTARVIDLSTVAPGARTTGLATGNFRNSGDPTKLDDILVATNSSQPAGSKVHVFRGSVGAPATPTLAGSFAVQSTIEVGPPRPATSGRPAQPAPTANAFLNGASLAVGDIDNAPDQRPELLIASAAGGLANFRVLANDVVGGFNQAAIDTALGPNGRFSAPPRSTTPKWQPTGGPDFFIGRSVPTPMAAGANAGLFAALVESSGRSSGPGGSGFRADVFAALAGPNQTQNSIRQFWFDGSQWQSAQGAGSWLDVNQDNYKETVPGVTKKLGRGRGLRLG